MKTKRRTVYEMRSRRDEVVKRTRESESAHARIKCSYCYHPGMQWINRPCPIDVVITSAPAGCEASVTFPSLIRNDLWEVLAGVHSDARIGSCRVVDRAGCTQATGYVAICVPQARVIDPYRGPHCRHEVCPGSCQQIRRSIWSAKGAIVERDLDDRLVYQDAYASIFIDGELVKSLNLKSRFPDLVLTKFPIVPKPLDGETLAGDPGWDGVFRPVPPPAWPPQEGDKWWE